MINTVLVLYLFSSYYCITVYIITSWLNDILLVFNYFNCYNYVVIIWDLNQVHSVLKEILAFFIFQNSLELPWRGFLSDWERCFTQRVRVTLVTPLLQQMQLDGKKVNPRFRADAWNVCADWPIRTLWRVKMRSGLSGTKSVDLVLAETTTSLSANSTVYSSGTGLN